MTRWGIIVLGWLDLEGDERVLDAGCGTGQLCARGYCQTPTAPGGQCVYDVDCTAAATCINGVCHGRCTADAACPATDRCVNFVCQPDDRPRPQCRASSDCAANRACINAICRTPCMGDVDCCAGSSGSYCRGGVCVTTHEAAPQCRLRDQCGGGQSCVDGACES